MKRTASWVIQQSQHCRRIAGYLQRRPFRRWSRRRSRRPIIHPVAPVAPAVASTISTTRTAVTTRASIAAIRRITRESEYSKSACLLLIFPCFSKYRVTVPCRKCVCFTSGAFHSVTQIDKSIVIFLLLVQRKIEWHLCRLFVWLNGRHPFGFSDSFFFFDLKNLKLFFLLWILK